ncbi:hypothetical protein GCM10007890_18640 [Methylobacterium tardum]|uniref:Uncharacterized protein n=1 Tax=Methylobacterium tardum TaxID=374432 RepID=A0AA37WR18_9HYPH|nr:hypothetical protein GCM10007890_18640 [Methylobacterium tardum]
MSGCPSGEPDQSWERIIAPIRMPPERKSGNSDVTLSVIWVGLDLLACWFGSGAGHPVSFPVFTDPVYLTAEPEA